MPATWVHGNVFVPRLYGPENLANVMGIAWTDQQGLRDGHIIELGGCRVQGDRSVDVRQRSDNDKLRGHRQPVT